MDRLDNEPERVFLWGWEAMNDTLDVTFPCFVITIHPFRFDDEGSQIVESTTFNVVESTDGTAFLLLFRKKSLLGRFLWETGGAGDSLSMEISDVHRLQILIRMQQDRLECPVGLLIDPDGELQGHTVSPDDAAK